MNPAIARDLAEPGDPNRSALAAKALVLEFNLVTVDAVIHVLHEVEKFITPNIEISALISSKWLERLEGTCNLTFVPDATNNLHGGT